MPTILKGTTRYLPLTSRGYVHPSDINPPTLPWLVPDTDYFVPVGGTLWDCPDVTSLLNAFANAADGDRIQVHAGVRYVFTNAKLPQHSNWVYVFVASKMNGTFPLSSTVYHPNGTKTQGTRVTEAHSYAALGASSPLAQFVLSPGSGTNPDPLLSTNLGGGGYWWFEGIEFMLEETMTGGSAVGLLELGTGRDAGDGITFPTAVKDIPNHFNFGHCLFHGNLLSAGPPTTYSSGPRRAIACNAGWVGVRDSYAYYIQVDGAESAAIGGWNCPGAFSSVNNFLSSAAQSILFGGSSPYVPGLVPRNFTTWRNHLWKDVRWFKVNSQAANYSVKNHYEHKNASVALVDETVMEHNTPDGQDGTNILFQVLEDFAVTPPSYKNNDITLRSIRVYGGGPLVACVGAAQGQDEHTGAPVAIPLFCEQPASRMLLTNILGDQLGSILAEAPPGSHHAIYIANSIRDLCIENVSVEGATVGILFAPVASFGDNDAATRLTLRNNVLGYHGDYGTFFQSGGLGGNALLAASVQGYNIDRNVFYCHASTGVNPANYPANNAYPGTVAAVGFDGGYVAGTPSALAAASAYKGYGTDGADPGADVAGINTMAAAVKSTTLPP